MKRGQEPREVLARWREAGAWWAGEPYREYTRFIDAKGIRREVGDELTSLGRPISRVVAPYDEDNREENSVRIRKIRDEKVAKMCGTLPSARLPSSRRAPAPFAALHVHSGYSFGYSPMLAEEIPALAMAHGVPAVLLADDFSLAGASEFTRMAHKLGIHPLVGATLEMAEGGTVVLVAQSKVGFRNLSRLITDCHLEEPRLYPLCTWARLERYTDDLLCLSGGHDGMLHRRLMRRDYTAAQQILGRLHALYGRGNVYLQVERTMTPWEGTVNRALAELSDQTGAPMVAGGPITHARRVDFPVQDVLVCIETLCAIEEVVGRKPRRAPEQPAVKSPPRRGLNAERCFTHEVEMNERYADQPELLEATLRLAQRCDPDVLPPRARLPQMAGDEVAALRAATYEGMRWRHSRSTPALMRRLEMELRRIESLGFAGHFLLAWDMCAWAEGQGIVHSGRGSVVDSAVAYCLGLSRIDAFAHRLHFDRFLPDDGSKRPDIDIDFEAHRREDIRRYLRTKYGDDHVATVAAFGAYCTRGIVREVGKVMGLPDETIGYLAKRLHAGVSPSRLESALNARPELRDSHVPRERFRWVLEFCERMMDVPRNIRAHSSGVILSDRPIAETVPVQYSGDEAVKIIQWDKRSAKYCFDKFDVLCLRGNDVLSDTQRSVRRRESDFDVNRLPFDHPDVYRTMRSGALIGIPQSASPAMRQAHIRLRTENLHDASLVQAGIRPGVGGAVKINELIARRRGKPYGFSHPELERILGLTYGIIVFQEQVDQLLQTFGGYTSGEAEEIRDAIHKRRKDGYAKQIREQIVGQIMRNGHTAPLADEVYDYIAGFEGYGFAQGHALAFAEISLRSVYCQQHFPAEYFAAILNAQPAGYYGPATLVNEARSRGVKILPADVNRSGLRFQVEDIKSDQDPKIWLPNAGVRVGLGQVAGVSDACKQRIVEAREAEGTFGSLFEFARRVRPDRDELERLILCGALDSIHPNRRTLLWNVVSACTFAGMRGPHAPGQPSLDLVFGTPKLSEDVEDFTWREKAIYERALLDLDIERHLMAFERDRVMAKGGLTCREAGSLKGGTRAFAVGNPIRLRFPPTQSGRRVVFFDLEDETGLLNVTCFDETYQRDGHAIICSPYVTVLGEAQDRDGHIAFLAHRVFPYRAGLAASVPVGGQIPVTSGDFLMG
ncbi:MAG: DNA polymerase III subunit alpha [Fimbriimonadaceae bacterium]